MGCNTSKESVPQPENENPDGNNQTTAEEKVDETDIGDKRSTSAKTVTSNGTKTINNSDGGENNREEVAAKKIQAVYRGHKVRQSMKQPNKQEETEPTAEQLQSEFREDDPELRNAATKIQASFRGHMIRKQMEKKEDDTKDNSEKTQENAEELDIDLSDPELNKAAAKIQASFRGHMVRKEHDQEENDKK